MANNYQYIAFIWCVILFTITYWPHHQQVQRSITGECNVEYLGRIYGNPRTEPQEIVKLTWISSQFISSIASMPYYPTTNKTVCFYDRKDNSLRLKNADTPSFFLWMVITGLVMLLVLE